MQKIVIGIVAVAVLAAGGWYVATNYNVGALSDTGSSNNNSEVVAVVNGEEIPRSEFENVQAQLAASQGVNPDSMGTSTRQQLQQQALDVVISQTLLRQAVADSGVTASQEDIDAQVSTAREQFDSDSAFQDALSQQGFENEAAFRAQIEEELAAQTYLTQQLDLESVTTSDAEIQAAYDQSVGGAEGAPPLSEVRTQVQQLVMQQKQQQLVAQLLQQLRQDAEIETRI